MVRSGKQAAEAVLSALLAVLVLTGAAVPSYAVTQDEIDALITQANGLQEQQAVLQDKISDYSANLAETMAHKTLLDAEIAVIEEEVAKLETQIEQYGQEISVMESELEQTKAQEVEKYEQFCQRVRAMEEQGRMNYWMILLHATSFVDFLTRLDFVNGIIESDQRMMDDLKALQEDISAKQTALAEEKRALEDANTACLEKKAELDAQREAANQLIIQLEADKTAAESSMNYLAEESESVQAEIIRLSEKLEQEEAEARAREAEQEADIYRALREKIDSQIDDFSIAGAVADGGYIWPVNSRRITSTFGGRASPGGIGSTNHKGVDIGGVGYGTAVHAAKSGVVIISQYSSSYGNFVVISHGSGNTTLYAHMSARSVGAGQAVAQGDVIGLTGSTGHSTGPHLHFEITENGSRINPLIYLGGYHLA